MFPSVIPLFGTDCSRVTHPSAARTSRRMSPLDLHVLGTPPAFVLSQDQTLMFNPSQFISISLDALRCLSQKSDCLCSLSLGFRLAVVANSLFLLVLCSLYRFQGPLLSFRFALTTCDSIAKGYSKVKPFFKFIFYKISSYYIAQNMPLFFALPKC